VWKRTEYRVKEGRYIGQSRGEKEAKRSGIEKNRCSTKTRKSEETARREETAIRRDCASTCPILLHPISHNNTIW